MKRADMKPKPQFIYGTAWKEERTADLVFKALQVGFRAIDTANQRKHYYEEAVGLGIQRYLEVSGLLRSDLFIQTKFTFSRGQDHRKPYDENASFTQQVADSFSSSLQHLKTDYIDSYVLHGPYFGREIVAEDLETWSAIETLLDHGKVSFLGISNVSAQQLSSLCSQVRTKPTFVQNRCFARFGWDVDVRKVCSEQKIAYQGFSLLTANMAEIQTEPVVKICRKYNKTIAQVIFRFCRQIEMICLTGTSKEPHMREDLDIEDFALTDAEVATIEKIGLV